jgi:hypothetical protein
MKRMLLGAAAITALLVTGGAVAQTSEQEGELLVPQQQGQGSSGGADQGGATVQQNEVPQTGTTTQDTNQETGAATGAPDQADGAAQEGAAEQAGAGGTETAGEGEGEAQTGSATEQAQPDMAPQEDAQSGQASQDAVKAPKEDAAKAARVEIAPEQRTVIRQTIVEQGVEPVDIDVEVNIGATIPQTVVLHPLPPRIIEIVPAYADYRYFILADGTIVIVDPGFWRIVYIIPA